MDHAASMSENILEFHNVHKRFPGVHALDDINFQVKRGTVHGIIGENGARKSTMMKTLIGIHRADEGEIIFDGRKIDFSNSASALAAGIAMVHQELMPIPEITVAQSIFLGKEPRIPGIGFIKDKQIVERTQKLFSELNISIDPRKKIGDLSIANIQLVEIAKAISYNAKLIIMDEPTSTITEDEVEKLFTIINNLRANGITILYISHKMDEIVTITDEVTVLRDGKFIATFSTREKTKEDMINLMVGRKLSEMYPKSGADIGEKLLEVRNFSKKGVFQNISFHVNRGEILGVAGLIGSGRSEVMRCVFGLDPVDEGEIYIDGKKSEIKSAQDAISNKMMFLTEDRKHDGLFLSHSVLDNMVIVHLQSYRSKVGMNTNKMKEDCKEHIEMLSIKTPSVDQIINNLSGGNQQKVLISKWLLNQPEILILDEPTRGIDVGAKAEIYRLMGNLAKEGKAIIMISSELPEIIGMSDRIIVMHEGKKTGELRREEATQERIMHYAFGLAEGV